MKMSNKRKVTLILMAILLIAVGVNLYLWKSGGGGENNPGILKIGFITDVHCYSKLNKETNEWEINWRCKQPFDAFIKQMNEEFGPDFVVEGGDFVDGRDRLEDDGFLKAKDFYDQIRAPKYHVLGNHETDNMTKDCWKEIVGYDSTYYYFDIKDYRMIVLDANNVQTEEGIVDMSPKTPHSYRGLMTDEQMNWLKSLFEESSDKKVIVFIHEPPFDETPGRLKEDHFINPKPLRDLFSQHRVLAVFSGHTEEMCDVTIDGVRYFSLQGFHKGNSLLPKEQRFKDQGAFYQVILDEKEADVEMFYSDGRDTEYKSMEINQDTAYCNNDALPEQE